MKIKKVKKHIKEAFYEIQDNPKGLLLETETLGCLESILIRETKQLCTKKEFDLLKNDKTIYCKEELENKLHEAKQFIDNYFGSECTTPNIHYFSIKKIDLQTIEINLIYLISGASGLSSIPFYGIGDSKIGASLLVTSIASCIIGAIKHYAANSDTHDAVFKKIILERQSAYITEGAIAHEYTHYFLNHHKIFAQRITEGFARNIQRLYDNHLANKYNDERYRYFSNWKSCSELNDAYRWACTKTGRKIIDFKGLNTELSSGINSYTLGGALFRVAEERDGINAYRNFIASYNFSRGLFFANTR